MIPFIQNSKEEKVSTAVTENRSVVTWGHLGEGLTGK